MSLIQEALKRQQQEFEGKPAPADAASSTPSSEPSVPPVTPPPVPAKKPKKEKGKGWTVLVGSIIVLILLLVGAVYFFLIAAKSWKMSAPSSSEPTTAAQPPQSVTPAQASTSATSAGNALIRPIQKAEEAVRKVQEAQKTDPSIDPAGATKTESKKVSTPVVQESKPETAAPPSASAAESKKATLVLGVGGSKNLTGTTSEESAPSDGEPKAVIWPKLTLSGVMMQSSAKDCTALINKIMVGVDETIEGVRVVEVRSGSVLLELEGETKTLYVGQSTF
jgi:hypothetical protein